jgi:hypothetical protein
MVVSPVWIQFNASQSPALDNSQHRQLAVMVAPMELFRELEKGQWRGTTDADPSFQEFPDTAAPCRVMTKGTPSETEEAINALEHECIALKAALARRPLAADPMQDDSH